MKNVVWALCVHQTEILKMRCYYMIPLLKIRENEKWACAKSEENIRETTKMEREEKTRTLIYIEREESWRGR